MFNLSPEQIAKAIKSPLDNVKANYPLVKKELERYGINSDAGIVAALATISVETRSFLPVRESFWLSEAARNKYFTDMYDIKGKNPAKAKELGNILAGDGIKFCGKGFVQTTGRTNHKALSAEVGVDLEKYPDYLLKPGPAATALAHYFKNHGCATWADKAMHSSIQPCGFCPTNGLLQIGVKPNGKPKYRRPKITERVCVECCWKTVRRTVNGGLNHYKEFRQSVNALLAELAK